MFFTTKFIFNGTNWFKSVRTGTYCPSSASFIGINSPLTGSIKFVGSVEVGAATGDVGTAADGNVGGANDETRLDGKSSSSFSAAGRVSTIGAAGVLPGFVNCFFVPRAFLRVDSCTVVMIAAAAAAAIRVVRRVGRGLCTVLITSSIVSSTVFRKPPSFSWNRKSWVVISIAVVHASFNYKITKLASRTGWGKLASE